LAEQASLLVVETLLSLTVVGLSRCGVLEMVAMLVKEGLEITSCMMPDRILLVF